MANTPNLDLITTPEVTQKTFKQWRLEMAGEEDSNLTKIDEAFGSISEALDAKTSKIQINYMGDKSFKIKGEGNDLTYKQIRDMLMDSPNFVLMVHGNREHRCTMIDDTSNPRQMRFVAPILSDGVLKTQSIYVTSNDGSVITAVTVSNINSENQSNKVQEITEQIKGSTGQYPSVKAVYDFVGNNKEDIERINSLVGGESGNLRDYAADVLNQGFNADGTISASNFRAYAIIPVDGYGKVRIVNTGTTTLTVSNYSCSFFRDDGGAIVGDVFALWRESDTTYDVPDGAVELCLSMVKSLKANVSVYGITDSIFVEKTEYNAKAVEKVPQLISAVYDGSTPIGGEWSNGSWLSAVNRKAMGYRVATNTGEDYVATNDTILLVDAGFAVNAYVTNDGITKTENNKNFVVLPQGSTAKITIARWSEDTAETADVEEFVSHVRLIECKTSSYHKNKDSFYGFGMFNSIGVCGDSYVIGVDTNNGRSWPNTLEKVTGVPVVRYGRGGSALIDFVKSGTQVYGWISSQLQRLIDTQECDLYWLQFHINDAGHLHDDPTYLGTIADCDAVNVDTDTYPKTFYGAYSYVIKKIKKHKPEACIVCVNNIGAGVGNMRGETLSANFPPINEAIEAIAAKHGVPFINQLDDIYFWSDDYSECMYISHPTAMQYPGICKAYERLFGACVRDNHDYFYNWANNHPSTGATDDTNS